MERVNADNNNIWKKISFEYKKDLRVHVLYTV